MKIIFMGTPDFALPSLKILLESKHQVLAVVTAPDKERGRGQKVSFTPVKQFALENGLPVLQPAKLKSPEFVEELKNFDADLFVIVAFRILPPEVFTLPSKGSFNLHASLLPKYRGAAPIQWALIKGEKETGVTTFALAEKVDTGNLYLQEKIQIEEDDNLETLHDKLCVIGAEAVLKTVNLIDSGSFELKKQNDELATPAPKIKKETAKINWNDSAENIHNLIRGLSPYPGAFFIHNNKLFKIYKSAVEKNVSLKPGEIKHDKKNIFIGCGINSLNIFELQQEGRKRLKADEFLRGFSFNQS